MVEKLEMNFYLFEVVYWPTHELACQGYQIVSKVWKTLIVEVPSEDLQYVNLNLSVVPDNSVGSSRVKSP